MTKCAAVGRIMTFKDVHVLIPRTSEYVHGQRDCADVLSQRFFPKHEFDFIYSFNLFILYGSIADEQCCDSCR